jgi:hypothetical protein
MSSLLTNINSEEKYEYVKMRNGQLIIALHYNALARSRNEYNLEC